MEKKPQNKLGRGLGKMLGSYDLPVVPTSPANVQSSAISNIRIDSIEINPYQPRVDFDEEAIQQLAQSIKTYGLIQPVTVRPVRDGKYQLISGERRLRACKLVGLTEIPAFVRTVDEINSLQMALVENIQRENLNAIEVAASYQRLLNECNLTVEDLSEKVGKDRYLIDILYKERRKSILSAPPILELYSATMFGWVISTLFFFSAQNRDTTFIDSWPWIDDKNCTIPPSSHLRIYILSSLSTR